MSLSNTDILNPVKPGSGTEFVMMEQRPSQVVTFGSRSRSLQSVFRLESAPVLPGSWQTRYVAD